MFAGHLYQRKFQNFKTDIWSKINRHVSEVIYPNPVNDILTIEFGNETTHIRITDIAGRFILDQNVTGSSSKFDTPSWPSGIYILTLNHGDGMKTSFKVAKQ